MKWCFQALFLVLGLVLAGCGGSPQVPAQTAASLRQEQTAAVVFFSKKSIEYDEQVYKVLYNEHETHSSTYEGIWDVDQEYTERWSKLLVELGVNGRPVDQLLEDKQVLTELRKALGAVTLSDPLVLPAPVKQALLQKNVRYVAGVRSPGFNVMANSLTPSTCKLIFGVWLIIYDVKTGNQEYIEHLALQGNISVKESLRELEANNLALLKENGAKLFQESVPPLMREALNPGKK
jgi:hypothetical protein